MRIRFTWTEEEWREAVRLAGRGHRTKEAPPLLFAVLLIMVVGACTDLTAAMRSGGVGFGKREVPLGLLFAVMMAGVAGLVRRRQRDVKASSSPGMPLAQHELLLREEGWQLDRVAERSSESVFTKAYGACVRNGEIAEADLAIPEVLPPADESKAELRPWGEFRAHRHSRRLCVLLANEGFVAFPRSVLSAEEDASLQRLLKRKIKRKR